MSNQQPVLVCDKNHTFTREVERRDGRSLNIAQYEVGDVGCVVWDAALVLSYYLESPDFTDSDGNSTLNGKTVIELGSGTGIVGIQAAACGADCVITDLEELVQLMQTNIDVNQHQVRGSIRAEMLSWGQNVDWFKSPPDYIMMADCIYYDASIEPLFKTVCELADAHTIVLCCYEERHTGNKPELLRRFLELFASEFSMERISADRQDPEFRSDDIHILRMIKKSAELCAAFSNVSDITDTQEILAK